jgi:hypothetical protein
MPPPSGSKPSASGNKIPSVSGGEKSSPSGRPAKDMSSSADRSSDNSHPKAQYDPADVNKKVIEYLVKKGYNRTEQTLRQESAHLDKDGRPIHNRVEELGNIKYSRGFKLLSGWIDQNLDIYKASCILQRAFSPLTDRIG